MKNGVWRKRKTKTVDARPQLRRQDLDLWRAMAMILMAVFHFSFNLDYFGLISMTPAPYNGWWWLRLVIAGSFLLLAGISLTLAHQNGVRWPAFGLRLVKISAAAALVSLGSWWALPEQWIYFGILHLMALGTLLGIALVRVPMLSLMLAMAILTISGFDWLPRPNSLFLSLEPWLGLPRSTLDLYRPLPWLAIFFLGMALASWWPKADLMPHARMRPLATFGRHGLSFYLLHQLLLFPLAYLTWLLTERI